MPEPSPASRAACLAGAGPARGLPLLAPALGLEYYVGFVRRVLIVAIAASSLNFILGYGGMAALGHAGFIGVGAYTVVALVEAGFSSAWLAWGSAVLAGLFAAAAIGAVSLRTRGCIFIMITLAFAQMLHYLAVSLRTYGGDDGYGLYTPGAGCLAGRRACAGSSTGWCWRSLRRCSRSSAGSRIRAMAMPLRGVRDNETRMVALGCRSIGSSSPASSPPARWRVGRHLPRQPQRLRQPSLMHWTQSALLLVMVMLSGANRRWGARSGWRWLTLEEVLKLLPGLLALAARAVAAAGGVPRAAGRGGATRAPRRQGGRAMRPVQGRRGLVKRFRRPCSPPTMSPSPSGRARSMR